MILRGGKAFLENGSFKEADIRMENGKIAEIAPAGSLGGEGRDVSGCWVLPGFVDVHTHGCVNYDFCDCDGEGIAKMLAFYGSRGITSVVPATMSFNEPVLTEVMASILPFVNKEGQGAVLRGVNMEGPFISMEKKGAQNPEYIMGPDLQMFRNLQAQCGGCIKMVDMAPELPGGMDFIRAVAGEVVVSLAHTEADYDTALAAFEAGASHVTHMFNAMPPFTHRDPSVVGAASDAAKSVEIISDGVHLHPSVVRAAFRWFRERICLVSDSIRATGLTNGVYTLGGQTVHVQDGKASLADGTLAGSATPLDEMCRRAIRFGVPMEEAIRAATTVPASVVGLAGEVGSLQVGLRADVVVWNQAMETVAVYSAGGEL